MGRSGIYVQQSTGYQAFIPHGLPFSPPPDISGSLQLLLSATDRAIGRLDAATDSIPNPDLFVAMYVRREALYSSQIEGVTQATLDELLEFEARALTERLDPNVAEVINYIRAMNFGLERVESLPLSLRLIREIHEKLLERVRGASRDPGQFRRTQNWIGPEGCTLSEAIYVPPPPTEVPKLMGELESHIHSQPRLPPLVTCALVHAQFETIHPFLDGNGRIGRLLITFQLCWQKILRRPLLYLSDYFKRHQDEYYQRLQAVRDRDEIEAWLEFFLTGVRTVALDATLTARRIQELREQHRALIENEIAGSNCHTLLDQLFQEPIVSVNRVAEIIHRSYPTANSLVSALEQLGLLEELTQQSRNRLYSYEPYRALFR